MINQETKDKWVAALRSGKYSQGTHCLVNSVESLGSAFCCLGVLCEVMGAQRAEGYRQGHQRGYMFPSPDDGTLQRYTTTLPFSIMHETLQQQLMVFNDDYNWTFDQIASWIEENVNP